MSEPVKRINSDGVRISWGAAVAIVLVALSIVPVTLGAIRLGVLIQRTNDLRAYLAVTEKLSSYQVMLADLQMQYDQARATQAERAKAQQGQAPQSRVEDAGKSEAPK